MRLFDAGIIVAAAIGVTVLAGGGWLWTPDKDRAELESIYLEERDDLIEIDGQLLHVRDDGPAGAPALIMLHGFASSLHTFEGWAQELEGEYRVVRLDLPGAGLSPAETSGDYSDQRMIELLIALMDQLEIDKAGIIGNSMGGRIAWRFAAANPGKVRELVLIAPDGFPHPGMDYDQHDEVPFVTSLMRYVLPKPLLRASLEPAYGDPGRLSEIAVSRYHDLLLAPGNRDAALARLTQLEKLDPPPILATIKAPTLLLWGELDAFIPATHASDYLDAMSNAELVVLDGLGHVPQEEAPSVSLAPLLDFLVRQPLSS